MAFCWLWHCLHLKDFDIYNSHYHININVSSAQEFFRRVFVFSIYKCLLGLASVNGEWHSWLSFYCWFLNGIWVLAWLISVLVLSISTNGKSPSCVYICVCGGGKCLPVYGIEGSVSETGDLYSVPPRSGHL